MGLPDYESPAYIEWKKKSDEKWLIDKAELAAKFQNALDKQGWHDFYEIPGFSNYFIDFYGNIKSTKPYRNYSKNTNHILIPSVDKDGYLKVCLVNNLGKRKDKRVHVLVAETFLENDENLPIVLHKDGSKDNNYVDNLYWGTHKQNSNDSKNHGTWVHGEKVNTNKLSKLQVLEILQQDNEAVKNLANKYGVTIGTIYHIRKRHTWKTISS